jgi:hypothetical protein
METDNKRITELVWQKTVLMRQEDRGEITREELIEKIKVIEDELKPLQQKIVQALIDQNIEKNKNMEEQKMAEEKVIKEKKAKMPSAERKPRMVKKFKEDTRASLIAKALQMKSIKSVEKTIEQVKTWNPQLDEKKLKAAIGVIIAECKLGKGRWKAYTWDEESFLLIPKVVQ